MNTRRLICLCLGAGLSTITNAQETLTARLARDPFTVPKFALAVTAPATVEKAKPEIMLSGMNLRSAVQAGKNSLVNVDGKIIAMGEKLEGYKLVRVGNGEAVFEKNGNQQTLTMEREQKQ
jgi:hypothetical protein